MSYAVSTPIIMSKGNGKYPTNADQHKEDLRQARKLYSQFKHVEFYGKGWVKIGGVVINGISKREIEEIEREIN